MERRPLGSFNLDMILIISQRQNTHEDMTPVCLGVFVHLCVWVRKIINDERGKTKFLGRKNLDCCD